MHQWIRILRRAPPPLPSPALPWRKKEGSVWNEIFKSRFSMARGMEMRTAYCNLRTYYLKAPVHTMR